MEFVECFSELKTKHHQKLSADSVAFSSFGGFFIFKTTRTGKKKKHGFHNAIGMIIPGIPAITDPENVKITAGNSTYKKISG